MWGKVLYSLDPIRPPINSIKMVLQGELGLRYCAALFSCVRVHLLFASHNHQQKEPRPKIALHGSFRRFFLSPFVLPHRILPATRLARFLILFSRENREIQLYTCFRLQISTRLRPFSLSSEFFLIRGAKWLVGKELCACGIALLSRKLESWFLFRYQAIPLSPLLPDSDDGFLRKAERQQIAGEPTRQNLY